MGPERRLHPLSFLFSMGQHLTSLLLPGIALFFTAGSRGDRWELWLTVLIVPYTMRIFWAVSTALTKWPTA